MTNTTQLQDKACDLGREHGYAAGSWVFDGNSSDEARRECLRLDEEGAPEWHDHYGAPTPFSGEWADEITEDEMLREIGLDPEEVDEYDREDLVELYTTAFQDAHRDEVLRSASAGLSADA